MIAARHTMQQARRQASTSLEGHAWRTNQAKDDMYLHKPSTWFRYYELLPVVGATVFAGAMCAASCTYAFFKEDVRVNNSQATAAYEQYHNKEGHRTKLLPQRKQAPYIPPEVQEVKKALGPYNARTG